uniref:Uncharacterized protein n=1 Tax=Leersia perrieri TaxID=77586 RepID=A0A0D9XNP3_9ORYZ
MARATQISEAQNKMRTPIRAWETTPFGYGGSYGLQTSPFYAADFLGIFGLRTKLGPYEPQYIAHTSRIQSLGSGLLLHNALVKHNKDNQQYSAGGKKFFFQYQCDSKLVLSTDRNTDKSHTIVHKKNRWNNYITFWQS